MAQPTTKTPISIHPAGDADIPALFSVMSRSFGPDAPFVNIYFPRHDSTGADQGTARLRKWKTSSPESHFLKAVHEGEAVGLAVWTLMREVPPSEIADVEDVAGVWPDEGDAEFMARLWRAYVGPRSGAVRAAERRGEGVWGE